jgi:hypothetical protein
MRPHHIVPIITRVTKGVSFPRWRVSLCHAASRLISLFVAHYADVAFHLPQVDHSMRVFDMERTIGGVPAMRKSDCCVLVRPTNIRALSLPMIPDPKAAPKVQRGIRCWGLWRHQCDMPKLTCHVSDSGVPLLEPQQWRTHTHIRDSNQ